MEPGVMTPSLDESFMTTAKMIAPHLPYLRRYARALTGNQGSGDAYVRATLETLLADKAQLAAASSPKIALYTAFHVIWSSSVADHDHDQASLAKMTPDMRLQALPPRNREALLLTAVEGFSAEEAGHILGLDAAGIQSAIVEAQSAIEAQLATNVLIIEDEPIIALDLEALVKDLGHDVAGVAATRDEAVALASSSKPGLVLADVRLADGSSGIDAATDILASFDVPVIFITAYPERLLSGERPEPAYLITKPFLAETVKATIGQALFFHGAKRWWNRSELPAAPPVRLSGGSSPPHLSSQHTEYRHGREERRHRDRLRQVGRSHPRQCEIVRPVGGRDSCGRRQHAGRSGCRRRQGGCRAGAQAVPLDG